MQHELKKPMRSSASLANESDRLRQIISRLRLGSADGERYAQVSGPTIVRQHTQPVFSPARRMIGKVVSAVNCSAVAVKQESWSEPSRAEVREHIPIIGGA